MILVTGGTGLVGSHLIRELVHKGEKVRAIRRKESDLSVFKKYLGDDTIKDKVEWVEADVTDIYSISDAMEGIHQVYHTAATVSFLPSDKGRMMKVNAEGTANVVNTALDNGIHKLCHVSSVAAIGRTGKDEVITENSKWTNSSHNSNYALSKYAAEREVWRGIAEGLNAVIVNPSIILGPADWSKGSPRIFSGVFKGLKFYSEGINAFVDVRDVAAVMIRLMESGISNERFIIMSENLSYKELFEKIALGLGKPAPALKAGRLLAGLAWRLDRLRQGITGTEPLVTKETARTASQKNLYSADKVKAALNYSFLSIDQSVKDTCNVFLSEKAML
jgi:dihydroflavonol-4-reductase